MKDISIPFYNEMPGKRFVIRFTIPELPEKEEYSQSPHTSIPSAPQFARTTSLKERYRDKDGPQFPSTTKLNDLKSQTYTAQSEQNHTLDIEQYDPDLNS